MVVVQTREGGGSIHLNEKRCWLFGVVLQGPSLIYKATVRLLLCLYSIYSFIPARSAPLWACPLCHPRRTLQPTQRKKADLRALTVS